MIEKEKLQDYARKLMFEMQDEEYETLQKEFEIILKQMDLIGKIKNIEKVEPMTFPFVTYKQQLREDVESEKGVLVLNEVLKNVKHEVNNQVKVPKVVE